VANTHTLGVSATAIGVLISFPLGFLAAANTSPHFVVYQLARAALNLLRTIPELIYGVLFVAAVGFGPLAGALALSLHSAGMVGKFFAEAVEHASPQPVEAVRATGARPLQIILHGVLPQVVPQFVDISIYRWEHNFRASTVMGMVGAGGIGFDLIASLRLIQYQEVCAILLIIFATVTVVDGTGAWLRRRVH
jgi:phosphonate transport system permease protein